MYNLGAPGYPIERVALPDPDPLGKARYSCIYWVDHLRNCGSTTTTGPHINLQDKGIIEKFIQQKYLYWLEALSLCKSMPKGVVSMAELEALIYVMSGVLLYI
ncbi:unnamed protein product [Periconia digitata]|uniref:Uncharacterized protein n=1 Tax=Periconia digitata TaxID=1303443 RepID=A0A9W4U065_9PLEO|nr:unnamed protein product [Periconia digitata]